jgi:hypothetical protein
MKQVSKSVGPNKPNPRPALRFIMVVVAVCIVDCSVVLFLKKPLPWAVIVPATIPMWVVVFVILPMQKKPQA